MLQGLGAPPGSLRVLEGGKDNLLNVRQVAAKLGVCTRTVYELCERGELRHVRVLNAIRIPRSAVAEYVRGIGACTEGGDRGQR